MTWIDTKSHGDISCMARSKEKEGESFRLVREMKCCL